MRYVFVSNLALTGPTFINSCIIYGLPFDWPRKWEGGGAEAGGGFTEMQNEKSEAIESLFSTEAAHGSLPLTVFVGSVCNINVYKAAVKPLLI